jgi:hypothetical protein
MLFDSGRVVFWHDHDAVIREAYLAPPVVDHIRASTSTLYELGREYYDLCSCFDTASTIIAVDGDHGRKTVHVHGFDPRSTPADREQGSHAAETIRRIYRVAWDALPAYAPMMTLSDVVVQTYDLQPPEGDRSLFQLETWPAELIGHLTGEQAQDALRRRGPGWQTDPLFFVDGEVHAVTVVPVLPLLAHPSDWFGQPVLPRHPAATAFNLPHYPYRFEGVSQADVARWHRATLPGQGWRLARDEGDSYQVWTRASYPHEPIVVVRFTDSAYTQEIVHIGAYRLPAPPNGRVGGDGCPDGALSSCVSVRRMSAEDLGAWLQEMLGYLGWYEESPGQFWRARPAPEVGGVPPEQTSRWPNLTPRLTHEGFRLEIQVAETGTVAIAHDEIFPPTGGWSVPRDSDRWPLCDETRAGEIQIGERQVPLHEAICVTLWEPDRLRLQVAYGASYVDIDPTTGQYKGMAAGGDGRLTYHLHEFLPMRPPQAVPSVSPPPSVS